MMIVFMLDNDFNTLMQIPKILISIEFNISHNPSKFFRTTTYKKRRNPIPSRETGGENAFEKSNHLEQCLCF